MGNCGVFIENCSEYLLPEAIDKFNIKIAPENTVLVSFKLTVGRLAITTKPMATNEAIAHFKHTTESLLTTNFLYLFLNSFDFSSLGSTSSIATAVNSKSIKSIPILVPTENLLSAFEQIICPIMEKIKLNSKQSLTLAQLRDALLPKLMSGQLRLTQAQTLVEAAV